LGPDKAATAAALAADRDLKAVLRSQSKVEWRDYHDLTKAQKKLAELEAMRETATVTKPLHTARQGGGGDADAWKWTKGGRRRSVISSVLPGGGRKPRSRKAGQVEEVKYVPEITGGSTGVKLSREAELAMYSVHEDRDAILHGRYHPDQPVPVCRCYANPGMQQHVHIPNNVDLASKSAAVGGALEIVRRAKRMQKAGRVLDERLLVSGTPYEFVSDHFSGVSLEDNSIKVESNDAFAEGGALTARAMLAEASTEAAADRDALTEGNPTVGAAEAPAPVEAPPTLGTTYARSR
jgi:hypothetical protein